MTKTKYETKADSMTQAADARYVKKAQGNNSASKNVVTDSSGNITTEDKPTIPTKTSDLTNDSGFLTSHQDISGKVDTAQGSSNASKNVVTDSSGNITVEDKPTIPDISGKADKTNGASQVTDTNANTYTNLGTLSSGATLQAILSAINTKIGQLSGLGGLVFTSNKGTATAEKMGVLYVESDNGDVDSYYVIEDDGSYSWKNFDATILEDVSISWEDITSKPTNFTPASHTHGNISNDGKVGTTSGKPLITTTGGTVTAGDFGTSQGQFAEGNHTHNNTSEIDTEIEAYIDAFTTVLSS